jgi:Cytochrome P450
MIFISLWSLFHDEKNFEEPSKFKPERFLSPEGKFDKSNPNAINFGIGKFCDRFNLHESRN